MRVYLIYETQKLMRSEPRLPSMDITKLLMTSTVPLNLPHKQIPQMSKYPNCIRQLHPITKRISYHPTYVNLGLDPDYLLPKRVTQ